VLDARTRGFKLDIVLFDNPATVFIKDVNGRAVLMIRHGCLLSKRRAEKSTAGERRLPPLQELKCLARLSLKRDHKPVETADDAMMGRIPPTGTAQVLVFIP
jgi:hypothetical protein